MKVFRRAVFFIVLVPWFFVALVVRIPYVACSWISNKLESFLAFFERSFIRIDEWAFPEDWPGKKRMK